MTFEEYKRKREKNEPRSWSATITMGVLAAATLVIEWATILAIMSSGLTLMTLGMFILVTLLLIYAVIVVIEGKWKSAQEALYTIFIFLPIP